MVGVKTNRKTITDKNFAVLASGFGSNLQATIDAVKRGDIKGKLALVVSDRRDAYALTRACKAKIPSVFIDPTIFADRESYGRELIRQLQTADIQYIVLAGFMRILSEHFVKTFHNRIINVHPALLPSFRGSHAIADALAFGVKVTGVTIHLVDDKIDHGPIVSQEAVLIEPRDTLKTLEKKIHAVEHRIYPLAINLLVTGKLQVRGRRVIVKT